MVESGGSINERKNDIEVLLEKQDLQFRALTEALKDSLNKLGSALDNSISDTSKSIDEKIDKLNSAHTSGKPEDLNREKQDIGGPSSDPNGKRRVGPAKLLDNPNKKRIISQDYDSLSLFASSDVEEELRKKRVTLLKWLCLVSDTGVQSGGHTDDILCELTEEFCNDNLSA